MFGRLVPAVRRHGAGNLAKRSDVGFDTLFDTMVERFFNDSMFGEIRNQDFGMVIPTVDVKETDEALTVTAELPGIDPKEVELSVRDGHLVIQGEKKSEHKEEEEGKVIRMERSYGSFSRTIALPSDVDESQVKAGYKDGVLTVTLPKSEEKRPRRIEIEES